MVPWIDLNIKNIKSKKGSAYFPENRTMPLCAFVSSVRGISEEFLTKHTEAQSELESKMHRPVVALTLLKK